MARHSIDKKTLKRDIIHEKMLGLVELANRYRKWVIAGSAAIVCIVALVFAYGWYQGRIAEQQAAKFYEVEKIMSDATVSEQERKTAAKKALAEFLEAYPDARMSAYAWMYLAQIHWSEEETEAARNAFTKALEHGRATEFTRHLATIGQAKLYESSAAYEASAEQYKKLPDKPFSDLKAYNLGRIAAAGRRTEEAREQFKKVVNHFPPSRLTQWANDAMSFLP
jgi:predicted negative regulator of RcsB-dependent stress response